MRWSRTIQTVDVHCAGEIGRVITGGVLNIPGTTMADIITAQLHDEQALADDAKQRGWASEHARHAHVATSLDKHLEAINRARA